MAQENATSFEGFSSLFNKSVPHILESIFFSLDGSSFIACHQVCKAWNELLSSEPYKQKISEIRKNETNLIKASCSGNIGKIIHLLSIGVDPNCIGNNGTLLMTGTPLHFAAREGLTDVIKLLLDAGADPNKADNNGKTALHIAEMAMRNYYKNFKLLLEAGANPNKVDNRGYAPLYYAAGLWDVVKALLDAGADHTKATIYGNLWVAKLLRRGKEVGVTWV